MADSKWDLCNKIGFSLRSLEQRCFLCTDPYLHARRDKRWEGKILWSILRCINKLVWSPCSDFRAKITPHGSWSFYLWATTSKSHLNNACNACGFCLFFFFFPVGSYTATDLHHNAVKHIRTKMKEERGGKKLCCYLCYIQSSNEFLYKPLVQPKITGRLAANTLLLQYKTIILPFSVFHGLFIGGWLALDLLYYHSFLLSLERVKRPFRSSLDATPCVTRKLLAQWKQLERRAVTQAQA